MRLFLFLTLQKLKYPISVFFIVVNEFCERFSYYGMRSKAIIWLFLIWFDLTVVVLTNTQLHWNADGVIDFIP